MSLGQRTRLAVRPVGNNRLRSSPFCVFPRLRACVVRLFGASLNPRHVLAAAQNGYTASTRENKKLGGRGIAALERLTAGVDRK